MSKKLFYARGQSDAARARGCCTPGFPEWAREAYTDGYLSQFFATVNRRTGQFLSKNSPVDAPSSRPELKEWQRGPLIRSILPPAKGPDIEPCPNFYFENGNHTRDGFWK